MKSRLLIFMAGNLCGFVLALVVAVWLVINAPALLVVDDEVHQADIAVVLGGGGGSRFRMGLSLYEAGLVKRLLLVDIKKSSWGRILKLFCPGCEKDGTAKNVVILEGSRNTWTDAELVEQYCLVHGVGSILVVTDPYHTRRAWLIFKSQFAGSNIDVLIVSSGDYVDNLSPDEKWWQDDRTLKAVWSEIGKIAIILLRKVVGSWQ